MLILANTNQDLDDLGDIEGLDDFDFTADGMNETIGENDEFDSQPFDVSAESQAESQDLFVTSYTMVLHILTT